MIIRYLLWVIICGANLLGMVLFKEVWSLLMLLQLVYYSWFCYCFPYFNANLKETRK